VIESLRPLIEFIRGLVPDNVKAAVNFALDLVAKAMQGEPVLVIGNGAAVVIYGVAKIAGSIPDLSFEDSLKAATAAIVVVNSALIAIRSVAYSPASVAKIVLTPPASAGPVKAAFEAGAGDAVIKELDKQEPSA
jgi:hypothetical protein